MTDSTHSSSEIHKEHIFEEHITKMLVSEQGYVQRDCEAHYNAELALDTGLLFQFLQATQPEAWTQLEDHYSGVRGSRVAQAFGKSFT